MPPLDALHAVGSSRPWSRAGGGLSFPSFFFYFKGECRTEPLYCGPWFVHSCQFACLNVGWVFFFPSYSSLSEGDSCFFYVCLLKEGCEGKIIFRCLKNEPQVFGAIEASKGQAVLGFSCESSSSGLLNHGWTPKGSAKCPHILISSGYPWTTAPNVDFKIQM